jgi:dTDP-4-dehydrorhamnose 3,5-epimerase-like enzyme
VLIDNWENPSKEAHVYRFVLSSNKPAVVYIPAGYANGFMSLTRDAKLLYFSTSSMEESRGDDIRYDAHYWDPWQVVER